MKPAAKPENHVDPPDIARMLGVSSPEYPFWSEAGNTLAWMRYQWDGPTPQVKIELCEIYRNQRFSAQAIYQAIIESVERLKLPGVRYGREVFREAGPFSDHRVYLKIQRELSEFLICAAPAGDSFFITVRKIDRFLHVKWFHYLLLLLAMIGSLLLTLLLLRPVHGFVLWLLLCSLFWSILRYTAFSSTGWLSQHLHEIPLIGPLYLRWFKPDTFYRQDFHQAFLTLVFACVQEVVAGLSQAHGIRPPTEQHGAPVAK